MSKEKEIIEIAKQIRASSQNGLFYSDNEYDIERYNDFIALSDRLASLITDCPEIEIQKSYKPITDYITPKVDIRAVVFNDKDEILLVQERADSLWSLPGGWADVGYTPSEVAVKEVKEETGLDVEVVRLLAVLDKRKHNHPPHSHYVYKFFILCEIKDGNLSKAFDILDNGFFALNNLPPLSEERVIKEQIDLMLDLKNNPEKGVILD